MKPGEDLAAYEARLIAEHARAEAHLQPQHERVPAGQWTPDRVQDFERQHGLRGNPLPHAPAQLPTEKRQRAINPETAARLDTLHASDLDPSELAELERRLGLPVRW
jgi:hypothetical protein